MIEKESSPEAYTNPSSKETTEWREKLLAESMDEYQELYGQYDGECNRSMAMLLFRFVHGALPSMFFLNLSAYFIRGWIDFIQQSTLNSMR